ncbi:alginate export family protein [Oxalobacteraceae bacterium OTU3CINTB1]|nr:alginate export family protein [Oxalobacteraceae bacterium OTU3CINTB1]
MSINTGKAWLCLPLLLTATAALAQFRPLRYDDDFSAQRQACAGDNIACWKDRPIAEDVRLSVGGDLRWRYEHAENPRYGADRQDKWGVLMQRASVFADLRLGAHWRGFAQLASSTTNGRAGGPTPVDEDRLDPTNLFVEWRSAGSGGGVGMRVGVQELQFGSGRVIDAREGPNVRRSFDAVRAYASGERWRVDAFAGAPRQNRQGSFDDARSQSQALRGVYATRMGGVTSWDVYLLHSEDTAARYIQGVAHERRWSAGTRVFGARKGWDWNGEFILQGGRFGNAGIHAWSLATDTGYTFDDVAGKPRAALLLAIASGDKDPHDNRLGTANPIYPRGNYFGDEATLGPRNFSNIHPALSMRPVPQVQLNASLDFFWRQSTRDGVYAPNGMLIRAAGESRARYVATIASLGATWTLAPAWSSTAVVAYAKPGAFLRETGASDPLSFVSLSVQYRF